MSTRVPFAQRPREAGKAGFCLYEDVLDEMAAENGGPEAPVYMKLEGVRVLVETTMDACGATLTMTLPRELARELGLVPGTSKR